ncbi:FkbM family methyltransferase [Seongchinamella sediminis]|uniref:FkbM family methyltransferase n=1 Tax=Seongchinamella sediminis TaxID=2283635 RepID=A0A3L7DW39_9GAMM|nr:FkbM family methyltransferase [Seongchinamella sediminis]RLQ21534.1 FkbM family methyltransferase [Seongchinamella sediminis]
MASATTAVPLQVPGLAEALAIAVHGERDRYVSRCLREQGIWEPYESSLVLAFLAPGDVFVDVGANIGYFSLLAASRVGPDGAVYAFEPDPDNFLLLTNSVALNGKQGIVHVTRAGLAAVSGEARLYLSEDNLGDHQIFATDEARRSRAITLLNGAEYLAARSERLDLLKIDTQGSEYGVVAGLMPLLASLARKPRIIIELTPLSLRQCGSSGRALVELLAELGEPLWIIDHLEHRLVPSSVDELAAWCDDVDAVAGDAGFMNILVGKGPG